MAGKSSCVKLTGSPTAALLGSAPSWADSKREEGQ